MRSSLPFIAFLWLVLVCCQSNIEPEESSNNLDKQLVELLNLADSFLFIDPQRSLGYTGGAIRLTEASGDDLGSASAYNYAARAFKNKWMYDSAYHYAQLALEASKRANCLINTAEAMNSLGNAHVGFQDYLEALPSYQEAYLIREQIADMEGQATSLYNIGIVYKKLSDRKLAIGYFQKALTLDRYLNKIDKVAFDLNMIGVTYTSLGLYDSAAINIEQAEMIFREQEDLLNLANVLLCSGDLLFYLNQYEEATEKYFEAIEIFTTSGNNEGILLAYQGLGRVNKYQGDYIAASTFYHDALRIADSLEHTEGIACIKSNLGSLFQSWGNYSKSLDYYNTALSMYDSLQNLSAVSNTFNNIGAVYLDQNQYDSAALYFQKTLEMQTELQELLTYSSALHNLGAVEKARDNLELALYYFKESLEVDRVVGDERMKSVSFLGIGQVYRAMKQYDKSEEYLLNSLSISTQHNFKNIEKNVRLELTNLYEGTGDFFKSLIHHKEYMVVKDSVYNLEAHKQIMNLQLEYEARKKQQQIEYLNLESNLQDFRIRRQRTVILAISTTSVLIIFFSMLIFLMHINKRNLKLALVRKNLEQAYRDLKLISRHEENAAEPRRSISSNQKEQLLRIKEQLEKLINNQKVYLNSGITLVDMAKILDTNSNYLSRTINTFYDKNFASFINELRIKEARKLLSDDIARRLSIEGIAESVGFNNRISFINAFKKHTGVTPSFYHKSISKIITEKSNHTRFSEVNNN